MATHRHCRPFDEMKEQSIDAMPKRGTNGNKKKSIRLRLCFVSTPNKPMLFFDLLAADRNSSVDRRLLEEENEGYRRK